MPKQSQENGAVKTQSQTRQNIVKQTLGAPPLFLSSCFDLSLALFGAGFSLAHNIDPCWGLKITLFFPRVPPPIIFTSWVILTRSLEDARNHIFQIQESVYEPTRTSRPYIPYLCPAPYTSIPLKSFCCFPLLAPWALWCFLVCDSRCSRPEGVKRARDFQRQETSPLGPSWGCPLKECAGQDV